MGWMFYVGCMMSDLLQNRVGFQYRKSKKPKGSTQ